MNYMGNFDYLSGVHKSPYSVLGIKDGASVEEAKKAYRVLCRKYHPDNGGDKDMFDAVNKAWNDIQTIQSGGLKLQFGRERGHLTHDGLFTFKMC